MSAFARLPEEIIENILSYLLPEDLLIAQRTCKAIHELANRPLLWRYYCQAHYRNWDRKYRFADRLRLPASQTDWKQFFLERRKVDKVVSHRLKEIVATQRARNAKIQGIAALGEDARDALLREHSAAENAEDVLARRFHIQRILGTINRGLAIDLWKSVRDRQNHEPMTLEAALGAYDLFVLGPKDDSGTISNPVRFRLDDLGARYEKVHPNYVEYTTRLRATTLARFLRESGFIGVSDANYQNVRNSFIGLALENEDHPALPLITVAIYSCVAERMRLDARPCGYPYHVYSIVHAPPGFDLDNKPRSPDSTPDTMYMDPFRSANEVPASDLRSRLSAIGVSQSSHATLLSAASVPEMVLRTARNIINSYREAHQPVGMLGTGQNAALDDVNAEEGPDLDTSCYAALWATMILGGEEGGNDLPALTTRRRSFLAYLCQQLQTNFTEDVYLMVKHIVPLFQNMPEYSNLLELLMALQRGDAQAKPARSRGSDAKNVKYRVGQTFQHKRYRYEGVITGWDPQCSMPDDWINQMGVDRLHRGRNQSFYHVLVEDKSVRYVAEDNIELRTTQPSAKLMRLAGRYFKRWDNENGCFVSNIREEYPDD